MLKNKFVMQSEWEDSVEKRWPEEYERKDGVKISRDLINWNESVNKEVENKQKQEQEKLEQQKLKDLKQKELQKASSSSTNTEQFPTKETGAIPKQGKQEEKRCKKKYKENREQKGKEQQERDKQLILQKLQTQYNTTKEILFTYFEEEMKLCATGVISQIVVEKIMSTLAKKRINKDKFYTHLKLNIENYCTFFIHKKLLEKDCIDVNRKKIQSFIECVCNLANEDVEHLQRKLSEYRTIFPKISNLSALNTQSIHEIIDHLTTEYQFLIDKMNKSLKPYSQVLEDAKSDICNHIFLEDELNRKRENSNLEKAIMSQKDCLAKINSILEELTKQHQSSPSSSVEEASTKPNSIQKINDQAL
ncbi:hypothetical protein [Candidatus Mesenet endosymbiont of Agriotes lineatus]|uniref:hypothetical protein n=1 Tax=Candidatus Mesenet endosymbiont of Agriotes lineatus TaxID=3077948 RepID=UPI0030CD1BC3